MGRAACQAGGMSSLDSSSTFDEVYAAYADNASYCEDGSVAKARGFITACRLLLLQLPRRATHGGRGAEEVEMDVQRIQDELKAAKQWLVVNDGSSSTTRFASFEYLR